MSFATQTQKWGCEGEDYVVGPFKVDGVVMSFQCQTQSSVNIHHIYITPTIAMATLHSALLSLSEFAMRSQYVAFL